MAKNTVNQISVKDNLIPADKFNNLPVNHTEYVYDYAKGSKNRLSRINFLSSSVKTNTNSRFNLNHIKRISDIVTALINNDILPKSLQGNYFQSGMADSREKFNLDLFTPTDSGFDAISNAGPGDCRSPRRN